MKWLGKDAISALAVDGKGGKAELLVKVGRWVEARGRNVTQPGLFLFLMHSPLMNTLLDHNTVMIVSYETLRTLSAHLASCSIGLLLCDEGHRLKNSGLCSLIYLPCQERAANHHEHSSFLDPDSLTFQSLNALDVKRRVILTGTPIQVSNCSWRIYASCCPMLMLQSIRLGFRMISQNTSRCLISPTPISWARAKTSGKTSRTLLSEAAMRVHRQRYKPHLRGSSKSSVDS